MRYYRGRRSIPEVEHELSGTVSRVAAPHVFGNLRSGCGGAHPAAAGGDRPHRPRLPVLRHARYGQDHCGEGALPGHQLPASRKRRPLRRMRNLQGAVRRELHGRAGDRRGLQHRRGRHPRAARQDPVSPGADPLQGLHHRRGAHALHRRVQRAAQDPGGAAEARRVHPGHHRAPEASGHDPLPLPALRLPPHPGGGHRQPPSGGAGGHRPQRRTGGAAGDRPGGGGRDARRAEPAGRVPVLHRGRGDGGACPGRAGHHGPGLHV